MMLQFRRLLRAASLFYDAKARLSNTGSNTHE